MVEEYAKQESSVIAGGKQKVEFFITTAMRN
jgi:hypothetical protein